MQKFTELMHSDNNLPEMDGDAGMGKSSLFWDTPCYIWDAGANCVNQQLQLLITPISEEN